MPNIYLYTWTVQRLWIFSIRISIVSDNNKSLKLFENHFLPTWEWMARSEFLKCDFHKIKENTKFCIHVPRTSEVCYKGYYAILIRHAQDPEISAFCYDLNVNLNESWGELLYNLSTCVCRITIKEFVLLSWSCNICNDIRVIDIWLYFIKNCSDNNAILYQQTDVPRGSQLRPIAER